MVSVSLLRPSWSSAKKQSGAFDLPSVLIGVAVVAILAIGVMATIFGVIPWAQDRAAKQDLAAVNTAQGTAYARDGSFTDKAALVAAGWLGEGTPAALDAKADVEGKCYVAVTTSKTGNQFVIAHDKPAPRELTPADTWCNGSRIMRDTAPVMISTWDTSLADSCKEIALPVSSDFKGTISWGDGSKDTAVTRHTFAAAGETEIRIDGTFSAWGSITDWADANCLVSVDRWGATKTTDLQRAFRNATNLKHVEAIPASTTRLSYAFSGVPSNFTIGAFDTSSVTDMSSMFRSAASFDQPVNFDTSNVTDMSSMFYQAAVFNQPVNFDTSKVTNMSFMFNGAKAFNQPLNFNTANVTTMHSMFRSAAKFNQPVNFDTSKVTDMSSMFYGAAVFNQPVNFDTSKVTNMSSMFNGAKVFNQPVNFDTSKVTNMSVMFQGSAVFNRPLNFDTAKVTDMTCMFTSAEAFNQPLDFDTSNVTTMDHMFLDAKAFNQDLAAWNVAKVATHANFSSGFAWTLPKPNWAN